jgi:hypothetical protein
MTLESSVLQTNAAGDRDLQRRIRAEYDDMPGLKLTLRQASRLFCVDVPTCERVMAQLVAAGALDIREESYVLRQPWLRRSRFHAPATPDETRAGRPSRGPLALARPAAARVRSQHSRKDSRPAAAGVRNTLMTRITPE